MVFGPVTQELLDTLIAEFNTEENKAKLKNVVLEPVFSYIHSKVYTYLQFIGLLIGLIILLLLIIIFILLKDKRITN